jgi:hypothetical protein
MTAWTVILWCVAVLAVLFTLGCVSLLGLWLYLLFYNSKDPAAK